MTMTLLAMTLCIVLAALGGSGNPEPAQVARGVASKALGIPEDQFQVKSVEAMEWADSSLGCGEGRGNYLPVVTPGFRVVLEANGKTHTVHVAGKHGVLCDRPGLGGTLRFRAADRLAELARRDLAARIGVPPDAIKKRSTRPAVWPDASLGCPKPDTMYAQVETPGFRIELEANGKTYRYHSDMQRVVPCD